MPIWSSNPVRVTGCGILLGNTTCSKKNWGGLRMDKKLESFVRHVDKLYNWYPKILLVVTFSGKIHPVCLNLKLDTAYLYIHQVNYCISSRTMIFLANNVIIVELPFLTEPWLGNKQYFRELFLWNTWDQLWQIVRTQMLTAHDNVTCFTQIVR